jgi:hypothetical protein
MAWSDFAVIHTGDAVIHRFLFAKDQAIIDFA